MADLPARERFEDDDELSRWTWLRAAWHETRCRECRVTWRSWFARLTRTGGMSPGA